jgi:hypothetical protein
MKNYTILALTTALFLTSCAHTIDAHECLPIDPSGFWWGLWNGICSPFTFIGSLIWDDVAMYDINNNGGWYDFGFVLGAGILGFGGLKATSKR